MEYNSIKIINYLKHLKIKTSEKWVTVISPDDLFKHGIDVDNKQMGCGKILNNLVYRKDITFSEFWKKTFNASDFLYWNNKLPEAKCVRECVNYVGWNGFFVLNIWMLAQQCKVSFPPKPRWTDCKHCNAQLLPECECLTSNNNRSDSGLQFALPKARSNSGAKMTKRSAIEIWSRIPLKIKNKTCLALFSEEYKK